MADAPYGYCDDGISIYWPGVPCIECGQFVGRDGATSTETWEMSHEVASVDGTCGRCLRAGSLSELDVQVLLTAARLRWPGAAEFAAQHRLPVRWVRDHIAAVLEAERARREAMDGVRSEYFGY